VKDTHYENRFIIKNPISALLGQCREKIAYFDEKMTKEPFVK
jgi:hypothetical protein